MHLRKHGLHVPQAQSEPSTQPSDLDSVIGLSGLGFLRSGHVPRRPQIWTFDVFKPLVDLWAVTVECGV